MAFRAVGEGTAVPFQVSKSKQPGTPGQEVEVWTLQGDAGDRAHVCPALGFNCFHWTANGRDLLYCDAQFLAGSPPTRSGIPILFPFPNRIRDGRFRWDGKEYHLPINDPAKKNSIHGFAVRRPWRVIDSGCDEGSAWITGEFHGSIDAPDCVALWPSDYRIRVTHRLRHFLLTTVAVVDNPGSSPLPFGLGYHHYFRAANDERVSATAEQQWDLVDSLPTGKRTPVDVRTDLREGRKYIDLQLDDVLTDLRGPLDPGGLCLRGMVSYEGNSLTIYTSPDFRELVAYTPPHRQAVALEPYTCVTDAINLQQQGVEGGLRVLAPGKTWTGIVKLQLVL